MSNEPIKPSAALDTLRTALTQLRALAALPSADPFYAQSAEQVEAIVAGLESRTTASGLYPHPPSPG
jgi:hypothetical protein